LTAALTETVFFPVNYLALFTIRHLSPWPTKVQKNFYHIPGGKAKQRLTKPVDPTDPHTPGAPGDWHAIGKIAGQKEKLATTP
jgi:hypothetical protein